MLELTMAVGDYDRTRPLIDGSQPIDGVNATILALTPEEMFFRAFRHADFDVCELSLSSFTLRTARGDNPYIGIPVFPSRAFRHTAIVVRSDRGIERPADLKGRRLGTPEYQLSACVWARGILQDDYQVMPADIRWVRGGMEQAGRIEKLKFDPPPGLQLDAAPEDRTLTQLLVAGEIDGIVGPRLPSCFEDGSAPVRWLFADPVATARDYYSRTHVFPIMHVIGIRRELAQRNPWLPATLLKAFTLAKQRALEHLADTSAAKVTLPFVEEQLVAARALLGRDFWSYGLTPQNRKVLDTFLRYHHEQGLSQRQVSAEELFHPASLELYRI